MDPITETAMVAVNNATKFAHKKYSKPTMYHPTIDVVAAADIAFRVNEHQVVKTLESEKEEKTNKAIVLSILKNPDQITQADLDEAEKIINYLQGDATMQVLLGRKLSGFMANIIKTLEDKTTPEFNVGMLLYAPDLYATAMKRQALAEQTLDLMYISKPLGTNGTKVTVNFTLIEYRYVPTYNFWSVYGKDEHGNLVSFVTNKEELCKATYITGNIKISGPDEFHSNATVTKLSHVKAI